MYTYIYRVIIIKVTISKIDNFKTTHQKDLIFYQNNREAMEFCLAKEKKIVQKFADRWRCKGSHYLEICKLLLCDMRTADRAGALSFYGSYVCGAQVTY